MQFMLSVSHWDVDSIQKQNASRPAVGRGQVIYILIIGFCILLRVILTVNNTFFFATIDKVF
jgi:hypothetical protein